MQRIRVSIHYKKVRVNSKYVYNPVSIDQFNPPVGIQEGWIKPGDIVRVGNLYGCPKANTMGQAYIFNMDGKFCGMVCTNSLESINKNSTKKEGE